MTPIIDMHNTSPDDIREGDVGLLIVKVMISGAHDLDGEWAKHFKLYRCLYEAALPASFFGEPQGDKVYGTAEELTAMCRTLYPAVVQAGILPNPDTLR